MTALQHLSQLADAHKARRNPGFPAKYIPRSRYNDRDSNALTRCVVDYLNFSGHFATRLASTGTYRNDLKRFVSSQQRAGMPDVFGLVHGHALLIEVKAGKDRLSDVQKETHKALSDAGGWVYVAHDFQGFYEWYTDVFIKAPFA